MKKTPQRPRTQNPPNGFDRPPAAVKLDLGIGDTFMGEILSIRDVTVTRGAGKTESARVMELEETGTGKIITWWPKAACIADLDRLKASEGDLVWVCRLEDVPAKTPGFNDRKVFDVAVRKAEPASDNPLDD